MSVGFYVMGTVGKIDTFTRTAKRVSKNMDYEISVYEESMCVTLCPLGDLVFTWAKDTENPTQWRVEMDCTTSQAGAGFHKAAIEFIEELGIQNMVVDDETDYFAHRDFDRMNKEHFYPWLRSLLQICHDQAEKNGTGQMLLCWDLDSYHPEDVDKTVAAPLGRYTWKYLIDILEHQQVEALADRFFLWGREEKDALFYRNRALYTLWVQCYFRPSSRSKQDREINGSILADLEMAYQLDPELPLPYETYTEVCRLHRRKPTIPKTVSLLSYEFPIGYRRQPVIESFGPLRLTLPGSYRYEWEDNGNGGGTNLWCDETINSPVWRVSGFQCRQGDAAFSERFGKGLHDLTEHEIPNGRIRYGWEQIREADSLFWVVQAEAITGTWSYLITVAYDKPEERTGIEELLERITAVCRRRPD